MPVLYTVPETSEEQEEQSNKLEEGIIKATLSIFDLYTAYLKAVLRAEEFQRYLTENEQILREAAGFNEQT